MLFLIRLLMAASFIELELFPLSLLLKFEPEPLDRLLPPLLFPEDDRSFLTDDDPELRPVLLFPVPEEDRLLSTEELLPVERVTPEPLTLLPVFVFPDLILLFTVPLDRMVVVPLDFKPDRVLVVLFVKPELRGPFRYISASRLYLWLR